MAKKEHYFVKLPPEILLEICHRIDKLDLTSFAVVSREFNHFIERNLLYHANQLGYQECHPFEGHIDDDLGEASVIWPGFTTATNFLAQDVEDDFDRIIRSTKERHYPYDAVSNTALGLATFQGNEKMIIELLKLGADPYRQGLGSRLSPWHYIMKVARRETAVSVAAAFLQSNRVDANEALPDGLLPLHLAIDRGLSSVFEILVDTHFADINLAAGEYGQTPLLRAVTARRTIIMDFLLREPHVDVNCTGHNGRNALILAVISGNVHVVERLLSKGVDVNHRDIWGQSAVAYAVLQNTLKVLQALLHDSRVDPNSRNKFGTAPLSIAAWYGDHHVVSLFLRYANIDVDLHNENGDTALSIAEARCVVRKIDGDGIVGPKPGFFSEDNATRNDRDENYEKTIAVIREFICHRQNGYEYRVL